MVAGIGARGGIARRALSVSTLKHEIEHNLAVQAASEGNPRWLFHAHQNGKYSMIPYHFEIKSGARGTASEFTNYITRMGSHSEREDLIATEHGNMPEWAENDPKLFFKASDKYERKNGSAFRAMTFNLPKGLTTEQCKTLALDITGALAGDKPYLIAIHAPVSSLAGESHPHGHLMVSDRMPDGIERSPEQTFKRFNRAHPERGGREKGSGGKNRMEQREWVVAQRKIVADLTNAALARHGHWERVDHRTLRDQGLRRKPERYLGPARIRTMSAEEKTQYVQVRHRER